VPGIRLEYALRQTFQMPARSLLKKMLPLILSMATVILADGIFTVSAAVAQIDGVTSINPIQSTQPSTSLVVRGTIKAYDAASKLLAVSTSNGTMEFTITSDVHIRQGWRPIEASALEKLSGYHAAVRYSESGKTKTVESVRVFRKDASFQ
jgi:hypothetical protein